MIMNNKTNKQNGTGRWDENNKTLKQNETKQNTIGVLPDPFFFTETIDNLITLCNGMGRIGRKIWNQFEYRFIEAKQRREIAFVLININPTMSESKKNLILF